MTLSELDALLDDIRGARVAVVGDVCLDVCWFLDPSRSEASVETGLATQPVRSAWHTPGGATNVAANLLALGCAEVRLFGVLGDDPWGRELRRVLEAHGIAGDGCLTQEGWATQTYVKPHLHGAEMARFDFGNFNEPTAETADRLLDALEAALSEVDLVVVNQQAHQGIHSPHFRAGLVRLMRQRGETVYLADTRHPDAFLPPAAQKMTLSEARRLCGLEVRPDTDDRAAQEAAQALAERCRGPVVITRNASGCVVHDCSGTSFVPAAPVDGPVDGTGAGDVFLAGLAAALAAGKAPAEAAALGALASAVTVRKIHRAGIATVAEIRGLCAGL